MKSEGCEYTFRNANRSAKYNVYIKIWLYKIVFYEWSMISNTTNYNEMLVLRPTNNLKLLIGIKYCLLYFKVTDYDI